MQAPVWWVQRNITSREFALWHAEFQLRAEEGKQRRIAAEVADRIQ